MSSVHVNGENFHSEVLKSPVPVLVDFYADWCGPCKMLAPILEDIADSLQSQILVAKVNVDEAQELAAKHSIMSIPTLLFIRQGQVVDQVVGVMSKSQILAKIKEKFGI